MFCFRRASLIAVSLDVYFTGLEKLLHNRRTYKVMRAHNILATFLFVCLASPPLGTCMACPCASWFVGERLFLHRGCPWKHFFFVVGYKVCVVKVLFVFWCLLFACFSFCRRGNHSKSCRWCALSKRCLLKAVCCIVFFVRRQLLLVFSILFSYLLLLCPQRTSSNLFVVVIMDLSVRSTFSARSIFQVIKCFDLPRSIVSGQSVVCFVPLSCLQGFAGLSCTQGVIFAVGNCFPVGEFFGCVTHLLLV